MLRIYVRLILATAREGCIAETLSALEMATEVDRAAANASADEDEMSTMLMRKTKIITLGRVGIRRLRGVPFTGCAVPTVLRVIARDVLETTKLAGATISHSGDIVKAWSRLNEALVPFVTMKETLRTWTSMLEWQN
jgi:hypothetical protein